MIAFPRSAVAGRTPIRRWITLPTPIIATTRRNAIGFVASRQIPERLLSARTPGVSVATEEPGYARLRIARRCLAIAHARHGYKCPQVDCQDKMWHHRLDSHRSAVRICHLLGRSIPPLECARRPVSLNIGYGGDPRRNFCYHFERVRRIVIWRGTLWGAFKAPTSCP